ncbi:hypothetical protein BDZ94DRAFT_1261297 [Collybia nuda]|uniref:RING-type domain-containing protein n=1 Tax=Collybia nuda TaxID=64659 RepID=A0A9P5Y333_9AGAR|nr:hypothetical protein BDZ94DRAFT_1261297 [Collybia nuda]
MAAVLKALSFVLVLLLASVSAYVPAQPTNSSKAAIEGGTNVLDTSKLHLRWFPNGLYSQNISYQLAGAESQGISKGALVHFSEAKASNMTPPTGTPWIAMISCDSNSTNASDEEDVFTLARDKGAKAALLYSLYSLACVINPEYADPQTFDQVFDIFSTQSLTSAHLIEYQFGQLSTNQSIYWAYDSQLLNNSASMVQSTIEQGTPPTPGYLFAILQASNATGSIDDPILNGTNSNPSTQPSSSSPNTALAMIILYAITGCVSALFCVVIVSGAIRAIRNPERYGPRRNGNGSGQSRARGITRAILDTFPVVKFGGHNTAAPNDGSSQSEIVKDIENPPENRAVELREWEVVDQDTNIASPRDIQLPTPAVAQLDTGIEGRQETPISSLIQRKDGTTPLHRGLHVDTVANPLWHDSGEGTSQRPPPILRNEGEVVPSAIGRETCPICIMDFEEGDNLRLLPCEGKHRFHQSCVDPWLLELSSSCPICRQDFLALENMLSGESDLDHEQYDEQEFDHRHSRAADAASAGNRFSRYLRFAKRRHRSGHGEEEPDPTDPYMPPAPESPIVTGRPNLPS